jgi:hypothetical protein
MGLRTGEALNALCPGRNGPSDIDHVIHNMHARPWERIVFFEYKGAGVPVPDGQRYLHRALSGDYQEVSTGRLVAIRVAVLRPGDESLLAAWVGWTWPSSPRIEIGEHHA